MQGHTSLRQGCHLLYMGNWVCYVSFTFTVPRMCKLASFCNQFTMICATPCDPFCNQFTICLSLSAESANSVFLSQQISSVFLSQQISQQYFLSWLISQTNKVATWPHLRAIWAFRLMFTAISWGTYVIVWQIVHSKIGMKNQNGMLILT